MIKKGIGPSTGKKKTYKAPRGKKTGSKRKTPQAIGSWSQCSVCERFYPAGEGCPLGHTNAQSTKVSAFMKNGEVRFHFPGGLRMRVNGAFTRHEIAGLKFFRFRGLRAIGPRSRTGSVERIILAQQPPRRPV